MIIVKPSATVEWATPEALIVIERAGRTCYKSEDKITPESAEKFVRTLIKNGHEAMIEHASASFRFVCDRGVTHEMVRHRLASFAQESTRYVSSVTSDRFVVNDENDVIEKYNSGHSMRKVSELSKGTYSEWDVYKILEKSEIKRRHFGCTDLVNHNYFDVIDTVDKAYLLGLIQADGSVRSDENPQVSISQHKDFSWYIQRMVRNFLRPSATRVNDKNCHSISVVSEQIRQALIDKGIVPNKSYDQTEADINLLWAAIPPKLIPSFLRGFLDGDGCIRFFKQKNAGETDSCNITWTGNIYLLEKIQCWLVAELGYQTNVLKLQSESDMLGKIYVTQPETGEALVRLMLDGFVYPYGHPKKTARMIERIGGNYKLANWGDAKFQVILPPGLIDQPDPTLWVWLEAIDASEDAYSKMLEHGLKPQIARSVLPTCLKTEIICTANFREWRKILQLRTAKTAHPQIAEVMAMVMDWFKANYPVIVEDILVNHAH